MLVTETVRVIYLFWDTLLIVVTFVICIHEMFNCLYEFISSFLSFIQC